MPYRTATIGRAVKVLAVALVASCAPSLPYYAPSQQVTVDQQWTPEQRRWFHHVSQGTVTFGIPYEWFLALPWPEFDGKGRLSDTAYLTRFGFLASPASPANPDALPIGFARGAPQVDPRTNEALLHPVTGQKMTEFGLTCAACHTGQIVYRGTALTIDGGAAMLNLAKLRTAVGLSIIKTAAEEWRFDLFAARVLGSDAPAAARETLRGQLRVALRGVLEQAGLDAGIQSRSVEEGFGRLDALNRIGNEVFAMGMRDANGRPNRANYAPTDAPVHLPHIWGVPWFDWAQYDGSIQRPMVRNAGEAMGVRALVNLSNQGQPLFNSSVDFEKLDEIETALAGTYAPGHTPLGDRRFTGLSAPRWPSFLPPIDPVKAAEGGKLYAELCAGCHLPAPNTAAFWDAKFWRSPNPSTDPPGTPQFLALPIIPISRIGTDPAQAVGLANRTVTSLPFLELTTQAYGRALGDVVAKVAQRWYDNQKPPVSAQRQFVMNGSRPNGIQAPLGYRTRPLDGIWATPPYLHNGSVPNLYALLSPAAERPGAFWLGSREYDPVNVGYSTSPIEGGFRLDTTIPGNSNRGHEFDDRQGQGAIGRKLAPGERLAIIEYLKSL